jgi:hypothetical protein
MMLRIKFGTVQYRILYFFHGRNVAMLAHGITKEDAVPDVEIQRAQVRRESFTRNPSLHTHEEELRP